MKGSKDIERTTLGLQTVRPTYPPTDSCKTICPLFQGGHKNYQRKPLFLKFSMLCYYRIISPCNSIYLHVLLDDTWSNVWVKLIIWLHSLCPFESICRIMHISCGPNSTCNPWIMITHTRIHCRALFGSSASKFWRRKENVNKKPIWTTCNKQVVVKERAG